MRAVIFGGTGLLGQSLYYHFKEKKYNCYISSKKKKSHFKSDLLNKFKIKKFVKKVKPNVIINCAGETNVDLCNNNFSLAYTSNVTTVKNIVECLNELKLNCLFVQISTDQVYNSKKKNHENNINLSNLYGTSKYLSELEALKFKKTLIIRTNFFGKSLSFNRMSYSDFINNNFKRKKTVKVPSNVFFNPVNLNFLSEIIFKLCKKKVLGVYNVGSRNKISKFAFVKKIISKLKLDRKYLKSYKSIYLKHQRPLNTFMNTDKLRKKLNIKIPLIQDGIKNLKT